MRPTEQPARNRARRLEWAALAAIVALALMARLWNLAGEGPWYDEVITLEHLNAPTLGAFFDRIAPAGTPTMPVYFAMEYWWAQAVGSSPARVRLLSVILSVLAIPVLHAFVRRLYDVPTALVAGFFYSASLSQIYYGQEIRMYAPIPLLALGSFSALRAGVSGRRRGLIAANVVLNALLLWTHAFNVFLIASQAAYLMLHQRHHARALFAWLGAHAMMALAFLAWVRAQHLDRILEVAEVITPPGVRDLIVSASIYAGGRPTNENPASHLPFPVSLDSAILLVVAGLTLAAAAYGFLGRRADAIGARRDRDTVAMLLIWLVLPPLLLLAISWIWRPVFVYRYALHAALPLFILAARGLAVMPHSTLRLALGGVLLGAYVYQLTALSVGPFRPDWAAASAHVEAHRNAMDVVIGYQSVNTHALRFASSMPEIENIEVWSAICPRTLEVTAEGNTVWLFVVLWADSGNFESCFAENNLTVSCADFPSWPVLRVYRIGPPGPADVKER